MRISSRAVSSVSIIIILILAILAGVILKMKTTAIRLPETLGPWTRPDSPQIVTSANIFDYMDGAGELYIGYRFNHLEVYEYTSDSQDDILVELYFMDTSDDAFGLLSLDWEGDPVALSSSQENSSAGPKARFSRALYGEGLLRIWSDELYARVMAYRETPEAKEAVLTIGRAIALNQKNLPGPEIVEFLSPFIESEWRLRKDRVRFFRSYLVLNSIYYISPQNILDLDLSVDAVTAPYEKTTESGDRKRVRFLLVKYIDPESAQKALSHFHEAFCPEYKKEFRVVSAIQDPLFFEVESGWLGYRLHGSYLAIVFDCPDRESAQKIIHQNILNIKEKEETIEK
jgi:hypothetical protein